MQGSGQGVEAVGAQTRNDQAEVAVVGLLRLVLHVGQVGARHGGGVVGQQPVAQLVLVVGAAAGYGGGRGRDVVAHLAQGVGRFERLHQAAVHEDVAQVQPRPVHGAGYVVHCHFSPGVTHMAVGAAVDAKAQRAVCCGQRRAVATVVGAGGRQPAVGVRPQHEAVLLGGKCLPRQRQHLAQRGGVGAAGIVRPVAQQLRLVVLAVDAVEPRRGLIVNEEEHAVVRVQVAAAGHDFGRVLHVLTQCAERILRSHVDHHHAAQRAGGGRVGIVVAGGEHRSTAGHGQQAQHTII